ncbi:MAG: DUF1896 domain-containing protein [Candidatus Azobacteroides sp.]|nr:DUF1896 domain-containing protein [Candidatus Azobacteroides sp.]
MNSKNIIPDLSYYRLSLVDFLRESHPERLNDDRFIATRAEAAVETYSQKSISNVGRGYSLSKAYSNAPPFKVKLISVIADRQSIK